LCRFIFFVCSCFYRKYSEQWLEPQLKLSLLQILLYVLQMLLVGISTVNLPVCVMKVIQALSVSRMKNGLDSINTRIGDRMRRQTGGEIGVV